ncbi:MAG: tetratricopeptide repeat protein [Zavarzinia sp.]|nr:tetratricopeptide repeat protein [Zavarzinia sp.]
MPPSIRAHVTGPDIETEIELVAPAADSPRRSTLLKTVPEAVERFEVHVGPIHRTIDILTPDATLAMRRKAGRRGVGAYLPPDHDDVARRLHEMASGSAPDEGDATQPDYSGSWEYFEPGRIRGWALDLARPNSPFAIEILLDDEIIGTVWADLPLEQAPAPEALCAFEFDLREATRKRGVHMVAIRLPEGPLLPPASASPALAPGEETAAGTPVDEKATEDAPSAPPDRIEILLPDGPEDFEAAHTLTAAITAIAAPPERAKDDADAEATSDESKPEDSKAPPLDHESARLLTKLVIGVENQKSHVGRTLDEAMFRLLHDDRFLNGVLHRLRQPFGVLRHFIGAATPLRSEIVAVTQLLPLPDDVRQEMIEARNWRGVLKPFLSYLPFFAHYLGTGKIGDVVIFQHIASLWNDGPLPGPEVVFHPGRDILISGLPEGFSGTVALEIYDSRSEPLARRWLSVEAGSTSGTIPIDDIDAANVAYVASRLLPDTGEAGEWMATVAHIEKTAAPEEIPTTDRIRLSALTVRGCLVQAVCVGEDLPDELAMTVGSATVPLTRRAIRIDEEQNSPAEARYTGRLRPGITPECLFLAPPPEESEGGLPYNIALTIDTGKVRPNGLPAMVPVETAPRPLVGAITFAGGTMSGWAASLTTPEVPLSLVLKATQSVLPPQEGVEPAEIREIRLADISARADAQEPTDLYGKAFGHSGFEIPLSADILDGQPYRLQLVAGTPDAEIVLWEGDFEATQSFLRGQIASAGNSGVIKALMLKLAAAKRLDFMEFVYTMPARNLPADMNETHHFEILTTLMVHCPAAHESKRLGGLFDSLWSLALTPPARFQSSVNVAANALGTAETPANASRFPQSATAEAAIDLAFVAQRHIDNADTYTHYINAAITSRRWAIARRLLAKALAAFPADVPVRVVAARHALLLGDLAEARTQAREALKLNPKAKEAERIIAQTMFSEGRALEALTVMQGGKGISANVYKPASYETMQLAAALDWVGASAETAYAEQRPALIDLAERTTAVHGAIESLSDTTFSILFGSPTPKAKSPHSLFTSYGPSCCQVGFLESPNVDEAPSIGEWAFIFAKQQDLDLALLQAIFAQRRPFEPMVLIQTRGPTSNIDMMTFETLGIMIRGEMLRSLGSCTLDTFIERAKASFKYKTVTI